jgi:hypothetical protein
MINISIISGQWTGRFYCDRRSGLARAESISGDCDPSARRVSWHLTILPLTSTMNKTSTLQTAIEAVEALSQEDQDFLFDLIRKRRITPSQAIQQRREEIRQNGIATMEAVKNGTAKRGTAAELIADILGDETD